MCKHSATLTEETCSMCEDDLVRCMNGLIDFVGDSPARSNIEEGVDQDQNGRHRMRPTNFTMELESITPAQATRWLNELPEGANRKWKPGHTSRYRRDMDGGRWGLVPDPIAFNVDGILRNGQHRLKALVMHGKSLQFWVARNVPDDAFSLMDRPATRTFRDVLNMSGRDWCNTFGCAIATAMASGKSVGSANPLTVLELFAFTDKHQRSIEWCLRNFKPRRQYVATNAAAVSVFARAWYGRKVFHDDPLGEQRQLELGHYSGTLERAARIMIDGEPPDGLIEDGDSSMLTLRRFLQEHGTRRGSGSASGRQRAFWITNYFLDAYMNDKRVGRIPGPEHTPRQLHFLIPGEASLGELHDVYAA